MTPLEFLRSDAAQALLQRAHTAAGVPLSLHYLERNQEGPKMAAWGQCAACAFVSETPGGKQACRQSRQTVSSMAVRQGRALPFVCHMGFSCVSVPALQGEGFVLTFGPYCPAEESRSLPYDALAGLNALLAAQDAQAPALEDFPAPLADIHLAPAASIPAIADWTVEMLRNLWRDTQESTGYPVDSVLENAEDIPIPVPGRHAPGSTPQEDVADLLAAVTASNFKQARDLLKSDIAEGQRGKRFNLQRGSARAIKVLAAVLEGLETAGLLPDGAWAAWPETSDTLRSAETSAQLLEASMRFLRRVRPKPQGDTPLPRYAELNAIVSARMPDRVTLEEVARELGETPSAITHRLQRKFGMSYSEYVGRLRVNRAKELLRRTKLSATEVGRRVGIQDQSNFGKIFRKYAGMTPQAYRKQYGRKP